MSFLNNTANRVGSSVNNLIGKGIGSLVGGTTFPAEDIPLYEDFLYKILADSDNAVTEPAYWVVFFNRNDAPAGDNNQKGSIASIIKSGIGKYISQQFNIDTRGFNKIIGKESNLEVNPWTTAGKSLAANEQFFNNAQNAMMLVQGIEIPGDGFGVERMGADNIGGFLRPAITKPRNDMPEMNITFLENNSSVTDLVLRPWVIHSSYASLKFANKSTITCYNLTRSPSGFRVRKKFTFFNAVPTSIDSEQYDYSSDSSYTTRQIKFLFSHYTLDEGSTVKDGLFDAVGNFILQKTRTFVSGVVESGVDVVAGSANQVFTNVKGAFVDSVNDHLQDVQTRIRDYAKNAESSIIDNSQRQIDKAIGFNKAKDNLQGPGTEFSTEGFDNNPSPRIQVDPSSNDALTSPPIPPIGTAVNNTSKFKKVTINEDDTPDTTSLNLQEVKINNSTGNVVTQKVETPKDDVIRR